MTGTMFFNMLLNIGLLVLLATLLTNMASVRKLFRGESSTIIQKMALAVIFGAISIVSTYTGTKTGGAIVNTRVIGVLTAGIMGGPFVGMMTALIAGAHRFCLISAALQQLPARSRRWWKACWEVWSIKSTRQERWTASICFS